MKLTDIIVETQQLVETKMVWARKGKKIARKFRCTYGKRVGRVVSDPSQCGAPIDMKKRFVLKRTKAQKGSRMSRKAMRTKKTNFASKMVRALNK